MNYGQKIAELRKGKNLTQSDLGAKLNVSAQAVSKWENNLSEPDIDSIRKLCGIFEISVDEFLGGSISKEKSEQPEETKIINTCCEKCHKPVGPGEYKIGFFTYNPSRLLDKVQPSTIQHKYCNSCFLDLIKLKTKEAQTKSYVQSNVQKAERVESIKKGLLWGLLPCAIILAISLYLFLKNNNATFIAVGSVLAVISYTFTAQLFWSGFILDVFDFFCRSFSFPFGFIFELSLDGIIWLLTVKLALWIICGFLSCMFFVLGIFVTAFVSLFSFPVLLGSKIAKSR